MPPEHSGYTIRGCRNDMMLSGERLYATTNLKCKYLFLYINRTRVSECLLFDALQHPLRVSRQSINYFFLSQVNSSAQSIQILQEDVFQIPRSTHPRIHRPSGFWLVHLLRQFPIYRKLNHALLFSPSSGWNYTLYRRYHSSRNQQREPEHQSKGIVATYSGGEWCVMSFGKNGLLMRPFKALLQTLGLDTRCWSRGSQ